MPKNTDNLFEDVESAKSDPWPHIPEGVYEAVCIKHDVKKYLATEKRLYLHYEIMSGEFMGTKLFQAINFKYKSFPRGSKYYNEWAIANRGLPKRKDKMSPQVFLKKAFKIKVTTVRPKHSDGIVKEEMFNYSKVDRIVEVLT